MADVQDTSGQAAQPPVCPQCGEAVHVQRIFDIADMPSEYGPPTEPRSIDLLGVALVVLGAVCFALIFACVQSYTFLYGSRFGQGVFSYGSFWFWLLVGGALVALGARSLYSRHRERAQWKEAMRRWDCLSVCATDEVAFITGGTSVIPQDEILDFLYADMQQLPDLAPELEAARVKTRVLACLECGHINPPGRTKCEECGNWVPQTAMARWTYPKGK